MSGRLPFDPEKMAARRGPAGSRSPAGPPSRAQDAISVSELAARIDAALKTSLPARIRVVGEVSGFTDRTNWYFQLKEAGAVVGAVCFASSARRQAFTPVDGQEVVATGRIDFYPPQGRVSLIVDKLEPVGVGALEIRFRALCDELRAIGWFDESRKRPVPAFPRRVAVVTSRTGAAVQDVIDTARRRFAGVELAIVDVRVQGGSAAPEIAGALRALSAKHETLGVDAVLLTRGGGSMEDLWAFNEREVAEAIVACAVPVVAAIGHESDTTVAELVADLRCATPTQAAMRLVPDRAALDEQVSAIARRLRDGLRAELRLARERLGGIAREPVFARPTRMIEVQRERADGLGRRLGHAERRRLDGARRALDALTLRLDRHRPAAIQARRAARADYATERLARAGRVMLERARSRVDALERELDAVGPAQVLARGYSITLNERAEPVRSVGQVAAGESVTTRVADGTFESVVGGAGRPDEVVRRPPARRPRRAKGPDPDQMDLFGAGG